MKSTMRFISGAIFGAMLGSLVVLLLTPESGEETRLVICAKVKNLHQQILAAADEKKALLEAELEHFKQN